MLPPESDDPEATFLRLQAWHAARLAIDHLPERLAIADEAVDLGRRTGTDEYAAWGRRWRMDAFAVLGDRIDLLAELQALQPLVERLDRPSWRAYLTLVECSQRLLEGRWEDARRLADDAVALEDDPMGEAAFFRVVTTLGHRPADRSRPRRERGGRGGAGRQAAVLRPRLDLPDVQGDRQAGRGGGPVAGHRAARDPDARAGSRVGDRDRGQRRGLRLAGRRRHRAGPLRPARAVRRAARHRPVRRRRTTAPSTSLSAGWPPASATPRARVRT